MNELNEESFQRIANSLERQLSEKFSGLRIKETVFNKKAFNEPNSASWHFNFVVRGDLDWDLVYREISDSTFLYNKTKFHTKTVSDSDGSAGYIRVEAQIDHS